MNTKREKRPPSIVFSKPQPPMQVVNQDKPSNNLGNLVKLDKNSIMTGIIFSEILGEPRSRKRRI